MEEIYFKKKRKRREDKKEQKYKWLIFINSFLIEVLLENNWIKNDHIFFLFLEFWSEGCVQNNEFTF